MNWFSIDFNKTFLELSPSFFRNVRFQAFYKTFATPLQNLADTKLYQMQHDSRVIYLEKILNEFLNVENYNPLNHIESRKIYISDAPKMERDYIYQVGEEGVIWLYDQSESEVQYIDTTPEEIYQFIVNIHTSIDYEINTVNSIIDYYKLAGKKHIIQEYI